MIANHDLRRGYMIKGTIVYNLLLFIATPVVDEEEEDEPLFIPFPLTTKRIDQPPYSRNGPEWVEYRRVLTDPKFRTWLRSELPQVTSVP
jgi:hypothetical protein